MNIQLLTYSDKAVVLLGGGTKAVKDQLKAMNGRFNPHLKHPETGQRCVGWIFSKKHEAELKRLFIVPIEVGGEPVTSIISTPEPITAPQPKEQPKVEPKQNKQAKTPFQLLDKEDKKEYTELCEYAALNFNYAANLCRYTLEQVRHIHANFTKFNRKSIAKENTTKDHPFVAIFEECEGAAFVGEKIFVSMGQFDRFLTKIRYDRILVGKRNRKTNQIDEKYENVLKENHRVKVTFKHL